MPVQSEQLVDSGWGGVADGYTAADYIDVRKVCAGDTVEVGFCFEGDAPDWLGQEQIDQVTARFIGVVQEPLPREEMLPDGTASMWIGGLILRMHDAESDGQPQQPCRIFTPEETVRSVGPRLGRNYDEYVAGSLTVRLIERPAAQAAMLHLVERAA